MLLHQPDRNNGDGHLDDRGTLSVRQETLPGRWRGDSSGGEGAAVQEKRFSVSVRMAGMLSE